THRDHTLSLQDALPISNASAMAMSPFKVRAGSASALLGFLQMGLGAFSSGLVSLFHNNTAQPMLLTMAICAILSLILHVIKRRLDRKSTRLNSSHVKNS